MKPCFENLVGLSRSECECFDDIDPELSKSKLKLWLDELEGIDLELIQNAIQCGDDLEKNFEKIYSNGVNFLESDIQVAISESYKQRNKPFVGIIGELKFDRPIATENMVGLKLKTQHVDGASIVVKSINLFFQNTGNIILQVYKNDQKLGEYPIEILNKRQLFEFPLPLNLPIVENGMRNEYYFVYEANTMQPMNNKTSCGCQGVEQIRSKFLVPSGVKGTAFINLINDPQWAYGLSLNAVISCSIDNLICEFMVDTTFERRAGMALWYKMGVLLIEKLFASRSINFDTFTDREYLYTRKKKFESLYTNLVMWLAENSRINESNCFVCDSTKVMKMGKILI